MSSRNYLFSTEQSVAIRHEANEILSELAFRNSDRCTKLFRFLVDESLRDEGSLKERRIGHEVFGREAGYDTAADPVVRNVASEVRKRLRQFYSEHRDERAVRIELPPGAYILQFQFADAAVSLEGETTPEPTHMVSGQVVSEAENPPSVIVSRPITGKLIPALIVAGIVLILATQVWLFGSSHNKASLANYSFWQPVFASSKEVLISVGHGHRDEPRPKDAAGLRQITMTDLNAYTNIASFLKMRGKAFQMQLDNVTTMEEMRGRPVVLIGNVNNEWVLRLTKGLRYRYVWDDEKRTISIQDSQHPGVNLYEVARDWKTAIHTTDYAIAERFLDTTTGDVVVCVAGAGAVGTQAASELITQPQFLEKLPDDLRDPHKNIQIILKTSIVDGVAGPPEIIQTYGW